MGMCKISWSERNISYNDFCLVILHAAEPFEVMNKNHLALQNFADIYTHR